jgi:Protein of unknown function (DUF1566)
MFHDAGKPNMQSVVVLVAFALSATFSTALAGCPGIPTTQRFAFNGAEVTDQKTGLVWARCNLGQVWGGSACSGTSVSLTHEEALAQAKGLGDWRLPSVKELASLIERGCYPVAIDSAAFPATTATSVWTATPDATNPSRAWTVDFRSAEVEDDDRSFRYHVRLVRRTP